MNSNEMKEQAQYIWNRLDDLATTDPDAYKKFIDEQMKQREIFNSPPEPRLCVVVKTKGEEPHEVYINICSWKRMPYPKDDAEPLKFMCGFKHRYQNPSAKPYITVPVAVNDKVLDELLKSSFDKIDLVKLILQFVTQEQKLKLEEKFEICKDLFKGNLPADARRLFDKNPQHEFTEASVKQLFSEEKNMKDVLSSPQTLLQTLSGEKSEKENSEVDFVEKLTRVDKPPKQLVQEIESEQIVDKPDYTMSDDKQGNIVLKISMPRISSAAECDLNISQSTVELSVPEIYQLEISLPMKINEDKAKAKFNKKSSILTLTIARINEKF